MAMLVFWSSAPAALGLHSTVVASGSMAPRLQVGDVVVSRPASPQQLSLGQVLLVRDPDHPDRLRLHRYVALAAAGGLVLRGDANQSADSATVAAAAVEGVAVLRIPLIGTPLVTQDAGDLRAGLIQIAGVLALGLLCLWYRQGGATLAPALSQ